MPRSVTDPVRTLQAKAAAAKRWNNSERDEITRDYRTAKLAEYIKRTVDAAPPLTAEQRDRLAALLRPMGGGPRDAA